MTNIPQNDTLEKSQTDNIGGETGSDETNDHEHSSLRSTRTSLTAHDELLQVGSDICCPNLLERNEKSSVSNMRMVVIFGSFCLFAIIQILAFHAVANFGTIVSSSPFHEYNPHPQWCPHAQCHNSLICKPCQRRFLIIIATGRSGSTTLTAMLGKLPGVRMAGENNGQLHFMRKAVNNLKSNPFFDLYSTVDVTGAWKHHPIPPQSLACPVQQMFETMNPPPRSDISNERYDDSHIVIGFKTVRFHAPLEEIDDGIDFLTNNFPCARFVVNYRGDVEAQKRSWEKAFGTVQENDQLEINNRALVDIAAKLGPDKARLIDMSEWSRGELYLEVLNDLIDWLGFRQCKFPRLLHENKNGYESDENQFDLGQNCHLIGN